MWYYCIGSSEFVKFVRIYVNFSQSVTVWLCNQTLGYTATLHYLLSHPEVHGYFHKICVYMVCEISLRGTKTFNLFIWLKLYSEVWLWRLCFSRALIGINVDSSTLWLVMRRCVVVIRLYCCVIRYRIITRSRNRIRRWILHV